MWNTAVEILCKYQGRQETNHVLKITVRGEVETQKNIVKIKSGQPKPEWIKYAELAEASEWHCVKGLV